MYKAGDFTNGKMNEIFKKSTNEVVGSAYDKREFYTGASIRHKQFGDFMLISERTVAIKAARLYCTITSTTLEDFYKNCDMDVCGGDTIQLAKVNSLIYPCGYTDVSNWFESFFMLSDRLCSIIDNGDCNPCEKYMELISNDK